MRALARRPGIIAAAAAALLVVIASGVEAQPLASVPRVGVLLFMALTPSAQDDVRAGFREHGYVDGQNIAFEWRSAEGRTDRAKILAAELVRLKVDVIVAEFTPAVQASKDATQTIPIVMASAGDPVATGLVRSLARPGANVTGLTNVASELSGKRLELVREMIPGITRLGLLIHGADPLDHTFVDETRSAASAAGVQIHIARVPRPEDLNGALAQLTKERVGAVVVLANVPVPLDRVARAAIEHRLPSISILKQFADAGGLMSYGASVSDIRRRAAGYVDRILKGAKPAELPVERPTKFELVVNQRTARTLGVQIPRSLLLRADVVIE